MKNCSYAKEGKCINSLIMRHRYNEQLDDIEKCQCIFYENEELLLV